MITSVFTMLETNLRIWLKHPDLLWELDAIGSRKTKASLHDSLTIQYLGRSEFDRNLVWLRGAGFTSH